MFSARHTCPEIGQSFGAVRCVDKDIDASVVRPDTNVSTITMEEKDRFNETKERLKAFLEHQVTNFRFVGIAVRRR
jgi:hypothetical protein